SERAEDLHELRIRAKRVRYAVELLQPCLGEAYRALHEQIQAVQETLGAHHDAHVLRTLVDERLGLLRDSGAETLTVGVARYRNVLTDAEENALLAFDHLGFDAVSFRTRLEAALIGA
ncbi:MAG TPA: CHAD domain-containing protein, partial [Polyangiaceae bacterium]|nr:CHAD domain-containing protein [Polyangiaceae bacterium]